MGVTWKGDTTCNKTTFTDFLLSTAITSDSLSDANRMACVTYAWTANNKEQQK